MSIVNTPPHQKYLIRQCDLANKLGMSVDALRKLSKNDLTFPRRIKLGSSRQSSVFYEGNETDEWIKSKQAA